ncbi:MAG: exodeoxyribonuclease VII small subunit [Planctomycetaceae bacterium]|jgi:exodeoxyribonuclease VII small subunit|nr:exodeoxyribonuclease VII small subunit [Planctomycetaceae bacterium]
MTFEESLQRLEEILALLQDGNTDLGTALERYEEGVGLLKNCTAILENAQQKIEILRDGGKIEPFVNGAEPQP